MPSTVRRFTGATATTALLATALVTGHAAAATAARPATLVIDCAHTAKVRPTTYTIACADGGNQLTKLRWTRWGRATARGTGVQRANDCIPSCANGHIHRFPVRVTLSRPERLPHYKGLTYFSWLRLDYGPHRPGHAGHATYSLAP